MFSQHLHLDSVIQRQIQLAQNAEVPNQEGREVLLKGVKSESVDVKSPH